MKKKKSFLLFPWVCFFATIIFEMSANGSFVP